MLDNFNGDHLFIVMGGDFEYINARMDFLALDRLINYFNAHVENV